MLCKRSTVIVQQTNSEIADRGTPTPRRWMQRCEPRLNYPYFSCSMYVCGALSEEVCCVDLTAVSHMDVTVVGFLISWVFLTPTLIKKYGDHHK